MKYLHGTIISGLHIIQMAWNRHLQLRPGRWGAGSKRSAALMLMAAFLTLQSMPAGAHGLEGNISLKKGYLVSAYYDDGEPMSYGAVEVKAPDAEIAFQSANLDRKGQFMFFPDTDGPWQVEVKDGMGHRLALDLAVKQDPSDSNTPDHAPLARKGPTGSKLQNAVTGLAILFGLFGCLYGWKGRRVA